MKSLITKISVIFFLLPTMSMAGWQIAKSETAMPTPSFAQADNQKVAAFTPGAPLPPRNVMFPNQFTRQSHPTPVYAISVSGSLKENIERIMDRYNWKVIWHSANDYNFDGRVTGSSLPNVIEKLLKPFPVQAVLDMSNRTMTIVPRKA